MKDILKLNEIVLRPSNSKRWINCTKSCQYENEKGLYEKCYEKNRELGQISHKFAEIKLKSLLSGENVEICNYYFDENIEKETNEYASKVFKKYQKEKTKDQNTIIGVERTVDCSKYIVKIIGTPDVFIVSKDTITVIDYKSGTDKVSAKDNSQLMIYAIGIIDTYLNIIEIPKYINMVIYQPKNGGWESSKISYSTLEKWEKKVLKPALDRILQEDIFCSAGEWCKYCNGKGRCQEHIDYMYSYDRRFDRVKDYVYYIKENLEYVKEQMEVFRKYEIKAPNIVDSKKKIIFDSYIEKYDKLFYKSLKDKMIFNESSISATIKNYNELKLYKLSKSNGVGRLSLLELKKSFFKYDNKECTYIKDEEPFLIIDNYGNNWAVIPQKNVVNELSKSVSLLIENCDGIVINFNSKDFVIYDYKRFKKELDFFFDSKEIIETINETNKMLNDLRDMLYKNDNKK